jgi:hypothetical protein
VSHEGNMILAGIMIGVLLGFIGGFVFAVYCAKWDLEQKEMDRQAALRWTHEKQKHV